MKTVHIVLWKWRPQEGVERHYTARHVNNLARRIKEHAEGIPVRVVCVTDEPEGIVDCETFPLWEDCSRLNNASGRHLPSCYRRLKLFDRATQREMGIALTERIVSLDLDSLICGGLKDVLTRAGVFVGWKLAGLAHAEVYNGSFWMFSAGLLEDVWQDFDPKTSPITANQAGYRGSDQSWLSMKLIGRDGCTNIDYPVFASYPLHIKRAGIFSAKTRIVFFHGREKPWEPATREQSRWISRYWRENEHALSQ